MERTIIIWPQTGMHGWTFHLNNTGSDEDEMCKRFPTDLEFTLRLDAQHPIRKFVEDIFPRYRI